MENQTLQSSGEMTPKQVGRARHRWFRGIYGAQIGLTALFGGAVVTLLGATLSASCHPYIALGSYSLRWASYLLLISFVVTAGLTSLSIADSVSHNIYEQNEWRTQAFVVYMIIAGAVAFSLELMGGIALVDFDIYAMRTLLKECQTENKRIWLEPRLGPLDQMWREATRRDPKLDLHVDGR